MLCENCQENEATIHYTEIVNGVRNEHHLCSECAGKLDFSGMVNLSSAEFPFVKLLTGLLAAANETDEDEDNPLRHICCPKCNMSFEEFVDIGKFGCEECYDVFGPLIQDNLKRIHGDNVHKGKNYILENEFEDETKIIQQEENSEEEISILESRLREAISIEDFEEAARLRDKIRALKG